MARTVAHMYVDTEEMGNADRRGAWDPAITGQLVIQEATTICGQRGKSESGKIDFRLTGEEKKFK